MAQDDITREGWGIIAAKGAALNTAAMQLANEYEAEGNPRAARQLILVIGDLPIDSKARLYDILKAAG